VNSVQLQRPRHVNTPLDTDKHK
jgi:hypothetical protein